jgi:hypothetical protein
MRVNCNAIANLLVFSCSVAALHGQKALSPGEQDQALAAIREYALNYVKSLPDYTCTRVAQQKSSASDGDVHRESGTVCTASPSG